MKSKDFGRPGRGGGGAPCAPLNPPLIIARNKYILCYILPSGVQRVSHSEMNLMIPSTRLIDSPWFEIQGKRRLLGSIHTKRQCKYCDGSAVALAILFSMKATGLKMGYNSNLE